MAAVVQRTHLDVKLYLHCLPCDLSCLLPTSGVEVTWVAGQLPPLSRLS